VVAALVGAASAAVALSRAHTSYRAKSTVFVDRVVSPVNGDVSVGIADFETALRLRQIADTVSQQTHVAASSITNGLSASRVGNSSTVQVSYHSPSPALASAVVVSAAHAALTTLAQQQVDSAIESVNAAQATATHALTVLSDLNQRFQVDDIEADYARESQNLINLQNQQAVTPSPGLANAIASERALVSNLAAAVPQYVQLKAASDSAQATLATSQQSLTQASGVMSAASSPSILSAPVATKTSKATTVARVAVGGAVAGAVVVLGLFLLWDLRRRKNEFTEDGVVTGTPTEGHLRAQPDPPREPTGAPAIHSLEREDASESDAPASIAAGKGGPHRQR
jgi:hypothetical protein